MCGIVGVAGYIGTDEKKGFQDLIIIDSLRGKHSTGVISVGIGKESAYFKNAINGIDFLEHKRATKLLAQPKRILIGHNRYATKGAINNINAHPFDFPNVIGVHNGTLRSQNLLPDSGDFEVDSENIFHAIDTEGIESTYSKLDGAVALAYYDKEGGTLNLIKNRERPMWAAFTKDKKTLLWASESWMIEGVARRNILNLETPWELKDDSLYTFTTAHSYSYLQAPLMAKPRIRELKAYVRPPVKRQNEGTIYQRLSELGLKMGEEVIFHPVSGAYLAQSDTYKLKSLLQYNMNVDVESFYRGSARAQEILSSDSDLWVGKIRSSYLVGNRLTITVEGSTVEEYKDSGKTMEGWRGEFLTEHEFRTNVDPTCVWCTQVVTFGDDKAAFIDSSSLVCGDCTGYPEVKPYLQ